MRFLILMVAILGTSMPLPPMVQAEEWSELEATCTDGDGNTWDCLFVASGADLDEADRNVIQMCHNYPLSCDCTQEPGGTDPNGTTYCVPYTMMKRPIVTSPDRWLVKVTVRCRKGTQHSTRSGCTFREAYWLALLDARKRCNRPQYGCGATCCSWFEIKHRPCQPGCCCATCRTGSHCTMAGTHADQPCSPSRYSGKKRRIGLFRRRR